MMPSTADVAVCCRNDSLSSCVRACTSSNSRVFSMADDGLVRESVDELDLAFGQRAHFGAPDHNHANRLACVDQRDGERNAIPDLQRTVRLSGYSSASTCVSVT
jgi:hypothetical protein